MQETHMRVSRIRLTGKACCRGGLQDLRAVRDSDSVKLHQKQPLIQQQHKPILSVAAPSIGPLLDFAFATSSQWVASDNTLLVQPNITVQFTISPNEWLIAYRSVAFMAFRVFSAIHNMANAVLGVHRLYLFVAQNGPLLDLAQSCLLLEVIANLLRFAYSAGDPLGANILWSRVTYSMMESVSRPPSYLSSVLLVAYWRDVTAATGAGFRPGQCFARTRSRVIFITAALVITTFDLLVTYMRAAFWVGGSTGFEVEYVGFTAFMAFIAIWYGYEGLKLLRQRAEGMKMILQGRSINTAIDGGEVDSLLEKKKRALRRSAVFLIVTSLANVGVSLCSGFAAGTIIQHPWNMVYIYWASWLLIQLSSTMQILTFLPAISTPAARVRTSLIVSARDHDKDKERSSVAGKSTTPPRASKARSSKRVHPAPQLSSVVINVNMPQMQQLSTPTPVSDDHNHAQTPSHAHVQSSPTNHGHRLSAATATVAWRASAQDATSGLGNGNGHVNGHSSGAHSSMASTPTPPAN